MGVCSTLSRHPTFPVFSESLVGHDRVGVQAAEHYHDFVVSKYTTKQYPEGLRPEGHIW